MIWPSDGKADARMGRYSGVGFRWSEWQGATHDCHEKLPSSALKSSKEDALKRGPDIVVYPERGRTMIAFGENEPAFTAEETAVNNLLKNPPSDPPPDSMIVPLIAFMCRSETNQAYQAAAQVARVGPAAIEPLVKVLRTDRKPASWRAAWALGKMGAAAKPAVADLKEMSRRTQDTKLREMIAAALGNIK
jgi:hypothetical protein